MQGSTKGYLHQKLAKIKERMKTGDISLKDAKEIVANAEGFTTDGDTVKFTLEPDVDLSSKVSPSTVDTVINDPAFKGDKAGSDYYMKQRGVGLGQNVDNLIALQGGTNADILDKTNRHDVNMALITPGARLLSALAYKNLIG
jgi:hypothetical protein